MSDLKACPFCGGEAEMRKITRYQSTCGCKNPRCEGRDFFVVGAWNNRPIEDQLTAELAEAKAEIDRLRECMDDAVGVLLTTYDVTEWPASGDTDCDKMAERIKQLLNK
ncbi:coil containing protein [Vibrio phage 1.123.O._10N.286.48.F3]|nr:coil containing protein [Vibrio phage 1.123.O._10N.286.48.F3]